MVERRLCISTNLIHVSEQKQVLVCLDDITEKKDNESALRRSEEKNRFSFFADLLQSASHPFTAGYANGEVRFVNSAACNLVGYSEPELLSKTGIRT